MGVVNAMVRRLYSGGKATVPFVLKAEWVSGPFGKDFEYSKDIVPIRGSKPG
jgi:hypothetical protein